MNIHKKTLTIPNLTLNI